MFSSTEEFPFYKFSQEILNDTSLRTINPKVHLEEHIRITVKTLIEKNVCGLYIVDIDLIHLRVDPRHIFGKSSIVILIKNSDGSQCCPCFGWYAWELMGTRGGVGFGVLSKCGFLGFISRGVNPAGPGWSWVSVL